MSVPLRPLPSTPTRGADAAWRWLESQLSGRPLPPVLTIIGLGDGSLLEAIDARSPATKVLVVEPDRAPRRATATLNRIRSWQAAGRLGYLTAPDFAGADQAWRLFPTRFEQPPLFVHPDSASSSGVKTAMTVLAKVIFGVKANAEARRRFAPRYLINSLRNLPDILTGRDVGELSGVAAGRPAIVIGAGPSLDRTLADLRQVGSRAVVIATDTSLRPLLLSGIIPQFVVALDPSELNARHLLHLPPCRDTWLVAESALDPRAVSAFRGRTFWFRVAPHQPWPWLNGLGVDVARLDVWGSVITAAFQLACLAGCDPILMAGADLSYPEGRPYARGTTYEFDWAWTAASGTCVEDTWRTQLAARKDVRVEHDLTGAEVPTTSVMLEFRDWILAQAGKRGRRLVNATGRGLLAGAVVEQGHLPDVLAEAVAVPPLFDSNERPRNPRSHAIAAALGAISDAFAAGSLEQAPLAAWQEFSGDGFDAARVAAAVGESRLALEAAPGSAGGATASTQMADAVFFRLPEALSSLRGALAGLPPTPLGDTTDDERSGILVTALERLTEIAHESLSGPPFFSFPDPALIGIVPAGAIALWPEPTRWKVLEFEALLAQAWRGTVPPAPAIDPAASRLVPAAPGPEAIAVGETPLRAPHACLLLAIEWLSAASSLGDADGLEPMRQRLREVEALMRRAAETPPAPGAAVELVLRGRAGDRDVEVRLPLAVSETAVSRVLTGALRAAGDQAWEIGAANAAALSVRAAIAVAGGRVPLPLVARTPATTYRPILPGRGRKIKVAGQAGDGALCVEDFTADTMVVRADGSIEPYQTWPRPITGALSLGDQGDAAWSNVWQPQHGRTPFLLYRATPSSDVQVIELPFRPARGLWWRRRLYLTCVPTPDCQGGVASWAPGEEPTVVLRNLPLQGLLPVPDALLLEPFVPGPPAVAARQRAKSGWRWTPGEPPTIRMLGPLGASSDTAVSGVWRATAFPQADVVALSRREGVRLGLRCYNPVRVGWAGPSLVVSGADGATVMFERLLETLEKR